MAGLRKDVELIFRGQDRASPTIKGVRDSVRGLTGAVQDQIAAAERGEGSIDDLAKVYKRLKDAQGDVGEITRLAAAYDSLTAKFAEQSAKAEDLRQKEAALNAEIASAEAPTKRLTNSRDAASRAADLAAAKEKELGAAVKLAGEAFEQAGGDLRNFEASQDAIRTAALETARGLNVAATALDNYNVSAAKGAQNQKTLAEAARFTAAAADSGLPQAQINYISTMENRIEALSAAMKENAASAKAMEAARAGIADAAANQRVRDAASAYEEAAMAADRLRVATEFKNQAASIEATVRDVQRFGTAATGSAASAQRLADVIQAISSPAQGAARSLDGINGIVERSEALFDGTKRRMSEYNASLNDLQASQAGLASMAGAVDAFRDQETAAASATQEFVRLESETLQLAAAIQRSDAPTQEMVNNLSRLEGNLTKAKLAMDRENTSLANMQRQLEAAGIDVRQLDAAEERLIATTTRLAAVQTKLRGVGTGAGGFMGLNPNELQNLGFQVNDIVVSLISGQNPLTVFVQQGAQIGQIWPGALSKLAARAPQIAVLLAVLIPLGAALGEVAEDGRRMNEATANLASMGQESASLNSENLAQFAERLEEIGVKAKDANTIMRDLMADGLNADQMNQYIEAAKSAAQVTGVDFKEALDQLREGTQGGMEDVQALQDATGVYTEEVMNQIAVLYEQGRADEARALATSEYKNAMDAAAAQARGPWKTAIDNLGQAWNNFTQWLANTAPIRMAAAAVEYLGRQAAYWSARLAGKDAKTASAESMGQNIKPKAAPVLGDPGRKTKGGQAAIREQREALESVKAVTAGQKRMIEGRKAYNAAIAAGAAPREADQARALASSVFDVQEGQRADKRAASAGKKADAAARRAEAQRKREARAAETAARKIASTKEQLTRQLEQLDSEVGNKQEDDLNRTLDAIDSKYEKLFRDIEEYSKATGGKGLIDGKTIKQAEAHAEAQLVQLKNYKTLEFREKELQNLISERGDKLDAIDDKVARGIISPEQGLAEADAVINDIATRVSAMAANAITFAETMRGVVPSPQLDAFIAKMQAALQNNSGGQNVRASRDRRKDAIDSGESALNDTISKRNQLIEHENLLVQLGVQTRRQAQTNIQGHYNTTSTLIRKQIADVKALAAAFQNDADPATRLYYQNLIASLQAAEIQSQYVDARFSEMKGSIDQLLTTNIIGFIDAVAQSFAALATGQEDILGFFASIGRAFLDMIAKTLQGIAMLILQMIVLDAVEKVTGIPVKALLNLMGGAGVMHSGGVVGEAGGRSRQVSPLVFAGAPKYHSGGIAGLAPDEMGAILRKGEEVITDSDPRHRMNGGLRPGGEGGGGGIRQVLAVGDDEIAGAMTGAAGENVVLTHIRRNRATLRQELGAA